MVTVAQLLFSTYKWRIQDPSQGMQTPAVADLLISVNAIKITPSYRQAQRGIQVNLDLSG